MEDIKRTFRVFVEVAFITGCGAGLLIIPLGISDFFLGTEFTDYLFETWHGGMILVGVGLLLLSFAIQEGQFSNYKKRYERHKEGGN